MQTKCSIAGWPGKSPSRREAGYSLEIEDCAGGRDGWPPIFAEMNDVLVQPHPPAEPDIAGRLFQFRQDRDELSFCIERRQKRAAQTVGPA
jgi:hypothetical protein